MRWKISHARSAPVLSVVVIVFRSYLATAPYYQLVHVPGVCVSDHLSAGIPVSSAPAGIESTLASDASAKPGMSYAGAFPDREVRTPGSNSNAHSDWTGHSDWTAHCRVPDDPVKMSQHLHVYVQGF